MLGACKVDHCIALNACTIIVVVIVAYATIIRPITIIIIPLATSADIIIIITIIIIGNTKSNITTGPSTFNSSIADISGLHGSM